MRRLIKVLVAALVLGLTTGVLLAAIPKIHYATARSQGRNNLKRIGMGLHNRYDTYGSIPPASIPNDSQSCGKRPSSLLDVLPFEEQMDLVIDRTGNRHRIQVHLRHPIQVHHAGW